MRTIIIAGLAAGLAVTLPSASASASAPEASGSGNRNEVAAAQPGTDQTADGERRICVTEALSESRIRRPICHTAREWIALEGAVPETR